MNVKRTSLTAYVIVAMLLSMIAAFFTPVPARAETRGFVITN